MSRDSSPTPSIIANDTEERIQDDEASASADNFSNPASLVNVNEPQDESNARTPLIRRPGQQQSLLKRFKDYMADPSFSELPHIPRYKWWPAITLTTQAVLPAELFFNGFLLASILSGVDDFYTDHGWGNETLIRATQGVLSVTALFGLIADITAVSPAEDAYGLLTRARDRNNTQDIKATLIKIIGWSTVALSQLGYAGIGTPDAVAVGQLNQTLFDGPSSITTVAAVYFLLASLGYYNLFLTKKIFAHSKALVNTTAEFIQNLLDLKKSMLLNIARHPGDSLDKTLRLLVVATDATINNAYRVITTMFSVYEINSFLSFGNKATQLLMISSGTSTGITTYMTRVLGQAEKASAKNNPFYFNDWWDFVSGFLVNSKTPDALAKGIPFLIFCILSDAIPLGVGVTLVSLLMTSNLYVGYCQRDNNSNRENRAQSLGQETYRMIGINEATLQEPEEIEQYKEQLQNKMIQKHTTKRMNYAITSINSLARVAKLIAFRDFIQTLFNNAFPEIFSLNPQLSATQIDMLCLMIGYAVARNDFETYQGAMKETIINIRTKWSLRNKEDSPATNWFSALFTPLAAYPNKVIKNRISEIKADEERVRDAARAAAFSTTL